MHIEAESSDSPEMIALFIEDICCGICQLEATHSPHGRPSFIRIYRDYFLGTPKAFANIRAKDEFGSEYFIEVNFGSSTDQLRESLKLKYCAETPQINAASKLVIATNNLSDELKAEIREFVNPKLQIEFWNESAIASKIRDLLEIEVDSFNAENLLEIRGQIERAQSRYAFAMDICEDASMTPLCSELLWLLGPSKIRQLRESGIRSPRDMLLPGRYQNVCVLMADLASFSSFVRDSSPDVTRKYLTAFCTKTRQQIISGGGMLYQFVGDAVLGFFGIPCFEQSLVEDALNVSKAILDIGASVSEAWQGEIDRVQSSRGAHIGLTIGNVEIHSLRPFSRTHFGAFGDPINMSARLSGSVFGSQIAASNVFYNKLDRRLRNEFIQLDDLEAKNVGRIKAWKLDWSSRYENSQSL